MRVRMKPLLKALMLSTAFFSPLLLLVFESWTYRPMTFDAAIWLSTNDIKRRGRMADDLVKQQFLVGQTREESISTLGKPDRTDLGMLQYRVAHIPRCSWIWPCYVQLTLDETGKVSAIWISD